MGRFSVPAGTSAPSTSADLLSNLSSHPMFTHNIPLSVSRQGQGMKSRTIASSNGVLIAVVGRELRMTSLVEKHKRRRKGKGKERESEEDEGEEEDEEAFSAYKIIHPSSSPSHAFLPQPITQLVLSPLGTVLALVSITEVLVISVPRWDDYKGESLIPVESLNIGTHNEYFEDLGADIVKVDWHPWGANGSSLLVLTDDAVLREFDISQSCSRPAQTISLLPTRRTSPQYESSTSASRRVTAAPAYPHRSRAGNVFGVANEFGQPAVSFTIGKGDAGWAPLTLYGLMEDGDVWAICPFMPSKCSIPVDYVEALAVYLEVESDRLRAMSAEASRDPQSQYLTAESVEQRIEWQKSNALQTRYVTILRNQVARAMHGEEIGSPIRTMSPAQARSKHTPPPLPPGRSRSHVEIRPPNERDMRNLRVVKQGPFRTDPLSADLELIANAPKGVEGIASDIFVLPSGTREDRALNEEKGRGKGMIDLGEDAHGGQLGGIGIVWTEGKVDMCIEADPVEAIWTHAEVDNLDEAKAILVYESIDLGLLDIVQPPPEPPRTPIQQVNKRNNFSAAAAEYDSDSEEEEQCPSILLQYPPLAIIDSFDPDTVYIQHAFGLHALSTSAWRSALHKASTASKPEQDLAEFWEGGLKTEVRSVVSIERYQYSDPTPLTGTTIFAAIPLPPSVIFMTRKLACGSLPLRSKTSKPVESAQARVASQNIVKAGYQSLLEEHEFDVEAGEFEKILADISARRPYTAAGLKHTISTVSSSQLTDLGAATEVHRTAIRDIKSSARTIDARLQLQVTESGRQLEALRDLSGRIKRMRGDGTSGNGLGSLSERWTRVADAQAAMSSRVDAVYQRLIDQSQPIVSDQEEKWFSELDRMEAQVNGNRSLDIMSLGSKLERLASEYDALKPTLNSILRDEERLSQVGVSSPPVKGSHRDDAPRDMKTVHQSVAKEKEKLNTLLNGLNDLKEKLNETA